jgi:pectate lyase
VVNNLYQGWMQYAIGGSMNPSVKSQANLFIAPKSGNKEVISVLNSIIIQQKKVKKKINNFGT